MSTFGQSTVDHTTSGATGPVVGPGDLGQGEEHAVAERALVFADPSGVIRVWNVGAEALFGHSAADAIGQTLDLVVPPDYRERHWAGYRAATAASDGDIDHGSLSVPALHRNGTVMRIEVRLHVVHDSRNRVAGAMAVFSPDDESAPPLTRL